MDEHSSLFIKVNLVRFFWKITRAVLTEREIITALSLCICFYCIFKQSTFFRKMVLSNISKFAIITEIFSNWSAGPSLILVSRKLVIRKLQNNCWLFFCVVIANLIFFWFHNQLFVNNENSFPINAWLTHKMERCYLHIHVFLFYVMKHFPFSNDKTFFAFIFDKHSYLGLRS